MKKTLLSSLLFLLYVTSESQNYVPTFDSSNVWYYTGNWMPILAQNHSNNSTLSSPSGWDTYDHYTGTDTIIYSKTYKPIFQSWFYPSPGTLQGFVREDTAARKIWYLNPSIDTNEYVLYDYSMSVGDSINIPLSSPGYLIPGYYTLDSMLVKSFNSINRRCFYLNQDGSHTLIWVEGIGNQGDFIYTESNIMNNMGSGMFMWHCPGFPYDAGQILTCFYHQNQHVYYDSCALAAALVDPCFGYQDSCHYGNWCGGVNEYDVFRDVKIYPNPATDVITLRFESTVDSQTDIKIYDVTGKLVRSNKSFPVRFGDNNLILSTINLPEGIYLLKLQLSNGFISIKFIIE